MNFIATVQHSLGSARPAQSLHRVYMLPRSFNVIRCPRVAITRTFTSGDIVCKGTRRSLTAQVLDEDDFAFDGSSKEDEELFGSTSSSETVIDTAQDGDGTHQNMRAELFNALHVSTLAILNLRGQMSQPPRKSTVVRLTALAENKEGLEKVLDVIAAWRGISQPPDLKTCEDFFGRCETLGHPEIALKALQNRSKYGMDIPSLAAARRLLHALSRPASNITEEILSNTLQLAELYPSYGLPPASKDIVSCATIASAISRFVERSQQDEQSQSGTINADVINVAWKDILLELKDSGKGQFSKNNMMKPVTLHRLKGRLSEIRTALRKSEERSELWLKRLESSVNKRLKTVVANQ